MLKVFQVCLATGAIFTVVSFLLGEIFSFAHIDIDGDIDVSLDTGIDADVDTSFDISIDGDLSPASVSPLKPIIIMSFITTFGGIGIICMQGGLNAIASSIVALMSASAVSCLLYRFIVVPLYKAQNTSAISQKELIGNLGKLTLGIKEDSFGKVSYTAEGNSYTAPAKSIDGKDIEAGSEVIIIEIKKNVFYVKKFYYVKTVLRSSKE